MKNKKYKSIYEIIDLLRERPATYFGSSELSNFESFLAGLSFSDIPEGEPSIWDFSKWITAVIPGISINLPTNWLEEKHGPEEALKIYLKYLDKYRQCEITILKKHYGPFVPNFKIAEGANLTQLKTPPSPTYIALGQYKPSKVFFLREYYNEDSFEDDFPCFKNVKEVKKYAFKKWLVNKDKWVY